jgi:hypothetical protein
VTTTSLERTAGTPARDLRWERGLKVAVLVAVMVAAPLLTRNAVAQRASVIQATAYVTASYLGAGLQQDSVRAATLHAAPRPVAQRLRIEGIGVVDVQTGPGEAIRVSRVANPRGLTTVVVQICYVGT